MSACDTCPKPGNCCNDFSLTGGGSIWAKGFSVDSWMEGGTQYMKDIGLPFLPLRIDEKIESVGGEVALRYTCPLVTPAGRCGDYENRPQLCRDYQPGDDRLCVLYVEPVTSDAL